MEEEATLDKPTKNRTIFATLKGLVFTLAMLALLWFGLVYVLTPLALGKSPKATSSATIMPLDDTRITALEERIAKLENTLSSAAINIDIAPLETRIAALENAPPPALTNPTNMVDGEEVVALKMEIENIRNDTHKALKVVLVSNRLVAAIHNGNLFAGELAEYLNLQPEQKDRFAPLDRAAKIGIATLDDLQKTFTAAINSAIASLTKEKTFVGSFKSLVKIRKVGEEQKGKDDEAIIARAEAKLARGEVAEALQEISNLSPMSAKNFEPWKARATEYLMAQDIIKEIE